MMINLKNFNDAIIRLPSAEVLLIPRVSFGRRQDIGRERDHENEPMGMDILFMERFERPHPSWFKMYG